MSFEHEKAKATRILATNCCCCGRDLVDAKSVEMGIGPVCRKKYANPDIETTDEMRKRAIGALAISGLADHVIDAVLERKKDARKVCNMLVYWASANYTDKGIVLACTPVIRLLGYTTLADKLERDRSTVKLVVTDDDHVEVYCPRDDDTIRGLRGLNGEIVRHETSDRFKCWKVSAKRETKRSLAILLGVSFSNEYCHVVYPTGDTKTYTIDPATWEAFTATLPRPKTDSKIYYRKTKRGEWVVFGPAHLVKQGTVTVTRKNGTQQTEVVGSTGRPFDVGGVPHVYGYLAPRQPNAGTATTPPYRFSYSY